MQYIQQEKMSSVYRSGRTVLFVDDLAKNLQWVPPDGTGPYFRTHLVADRTKGLSGSEMMNILLLCGFSGDRPVLNNEHVSKKIKNEHVSRRPIPERELIVQTPTCLKCGIFGKSGRVSCCTPGGAWFKNCGGFGSKNVDYRWSEGVNACK